MVSILLEMTLCHWPHDFFWQLFHGGTWFVPLQRLSLYGTWFLLLFCSNCLLLSIYTTSPFVKYIIICVLPMTCFILYYKSRRTVCVSWLVCFMLILTYIFSKARCSLSQTMSNRNCSGWVENINDEVSNCEGFSILMRTSSLWPK